MRVAVDQPGKERLAAAVVDIGVRIGLEDLIGRTDRGDPVADNGERDVVLHGVRVDDGRIRKDDDAAGRLRREVARIEEKSRGAGTGSGQYLTPRELD